MRWGREHLCLSKTWLELPFQTHLLLLPYKCSFLHSHWSSPLARLTPVPTQNPLLPLPFSHLSSSLSCENRLVFWEAMDVPKEKPELRTTHVHAVCAAHGASGWRDLRRRQLLLRAICNSDPMMLYLKAWITSTSSSLPVLLDTFLFWNPVSPQFFHTSLDTGYISPWFHKLFFMSVLLFIYSDLQKEGICKNTKFHRQLRASYNMFTQIGSKSKAFSHWLTRKVVRECHDPKFSPPNPASLKSRSMWEGSNKVSSTNTISRLPRELSLSPFFLLFFTPSGFIQ